MERENLKSQRKRWKKELEELRALLARRNLSKKEKRRVFKRVKCLRKKLRNNSS